MELPSSKEEKSRGEEEGEGGREGEREEGF